LLLGYRNSQLPADMGQHLIDPGAGGDDQLPAGKCPGPGFYIYPAVDGADRFDGAAIENRCAVPAGHSDVCRIALGGIGNAGVGLPQGVHFLIEPELRKTPHPSTM
jgi:hypothetical protein